MNNLISKVKSSYLSIENKIPKRAAILSSVALLVGLIIAISVAAANAKAASQYDAIVDALNNNLWSDSGTDTNANSTVPDDITDSDNDTASEPTIEATAPITLSDDQVIMIDDRCEFYIDFSNITKTVYPPSQASFYTYYEAGDGKVYVDICMAYKNLTANAVGADEVVSAILKYDDKYEYAGFSIIEEQNRGNFTYTNITSIAPLSTEYVHYLFEVPEVVNDGTESIVINLRIGSNDYIYTVR